MWSFIKNFILSPRQTGAVLPSSPTLVKAMVQQIDFSKAKQIVELGPGTGALTRLLLKKMKKDAKLTVIEINKEFCEELRKIKDNRLKVILGNASKLSTYVSAPDYVVSGLPLVGFSPKKHAQILKEIKRVVKNSYVQFHYSPLGEQALKKQFSTVKRQIVLKNVPPAIVYTALP